MKSIQERLCEKCAAGREPLEVFIDKPLPGNYQRGYQELRRWYPMDSVTEWCCLCRLMSELTDHPRNASSHTHVRLYADTIHRDEFERPPEAAIVYLEFRWSRSVRRWFFFENEEEDHVCGTVGYAHQVLPILEDNDWALARHWIDECAKLHKAPCISPKSIDLAGFEVINCATRELVPGFEGVEYAALSYVWGRSQSQNPVSDRTVLPNPFPERVIEDALICALRLGICYLWVDRYCISQEDDSSAIKQCLIQSMDEIYSAARITLVSVAGIDATTGLPGVSTTPRTSLRKTVIYGHCVVEVSNPADHIASSKWITRGWTLQEGVLARRRLVFTDTQIYFQCTRSHCVESVSGAFNSNGILDANFGHHRGPRLSTQAFPSSTIGSSSYSVKQMCEEFAKRALTKDEDALRACSGILARLWKGETPVFHFYGLPFYANSEADVARSLFWTANLPQGFENDCPSARRACGPSWSWLAWKGTDVSFHRGYLPNDSKLMQWFATLRMQHLDKTESSTISEYIQDITAGVIHSNWLPYLELTGWLATVHLAPNPNDFRSQYCYTDGYQRSLGDAELRGDGLIDEWLTVMPVAYDGSFWLYSLVLRCQYSPTTRHQYKQLGIVRHFCMPPAVQEELDYAHITISSGGVRLECTKAKVQLV